MGNNVVWDLDFEVDDDPELEILATEDLARPTLFVAPDQQKVRPFRLDDGEMVGALAGFESERVGYEPETSSTTDNLPFNIEEVEHADGDGLRRMAQALGLDTRAAVTKLRQCLVLIIGSPMVPQELDDSNLKHLLKKELKGLAKKYGLPYTGLKEILLERLVHFKRATWGAA